MKKNAPFPSSRSLHFFQQPGPPLYLQLAGIFRQQIENGELAPGEKLPNLHELAAQFGIARVTVRQAVRLLAAEGFLISSQGRGTYVAQTVPERPHENMRTSWSAMVRRIEGASVELLEQADVSVCPLLDRDERRAAPVYHYMKRVHIKDGVRFGFIDVYLDKRIFDLAPARFNQTTVIPVLGELNIKVAKARQIVTIDTVTAEAARHLRLQPGSPVALLKRMAQEPSGCIIYMAKIVHPGYLVRFDIDLSG
ncbi:MAG: GntR family transcriptional regulator [Deltaproteobacteria bacterium]|jgi:GntR family transcriptional regulator|nr:GntR family transcriptional regulator [Deltaproteobacteria bacterium]